MINLKHLSLALYLCLGYALLSNATQASSSIEQALSLANSASIETQAQEQSNNTLKEQASFIEKALPNQSNGQNEQALVQDKALNDSTSPAHQERLEQATDLATTDAMGAGAMQGPNVSCLPIMPHEAVPLYIRPKQCFELQGGNAITGDLSVQGKLFIKAGRKVTLKSGHSITVRNGGLFEIRGELDLQKYSAINIDHTSSFNCTGLLYMANKSQFNTRGNTSIKNIGKILVEPQGQIIFSDNTKFRNSGQIALDNAIWEIRNKGEIINAGTLDLISGAKLQFLDKSHFINSGKTNLNANSQISFIDYSRFESRRMFAPQGIVTLSKNAVFENLASFKQQSGSSLVIRDNAQLLNNHTFELSGQSTFTGRARVLNDGVFAVKKTAKVNTEQMAVMINTGTFRNEGGAFTIDNQNNFINDNIVSGHESRTQGRNRL